MADPDDSSEAIGVPRTSRRVAGEESDCRRERAQAVEQGRIGAAAHPEVHKRLLDQSVGNDPIDDLREDVARLEGKVDALLTALEVADGDGD
jgi:hypothetical protein